MLHRRAVCNLAISSPIQESGEDAQMPNLKKKKKKKKMKRSMLRQLLKVRTRSEIPALTHD
jgi:hypothetical protein